MGTVVWEPVEDTEKIARGLRTMIEWNDLYEYVDCKVCRAITVPDTTQRVPAVLSVAMTPARIAALEILLDPDFADADQQAQAHVAILGMLREVASR